MRCIRGLAAAASPAAAPAPAPLPSQHAFRSPVQHLFYSSSSSFSYAAPLRVATADGRTPWTAGGRARPEAGILRESCVKTRRLPRVLLSSLSSLSPSSSSSPGLRAGLRWSGAPSGSRAASGSGSGTEPLLEEQEEGGSDGSGSGSASTTSTTGASGTSSSTDLDRGREEKAKDGKTSIKIYSFEEIQSLLAHPNHPDEGPPPKVLIDVREPHELHTTGTIPTAFNMPLNTHPDALFLPAPAFHATFHAPKPDPARDEVIFYCRSGVRSSVAAELATRAGYVHHSSFALTEFANARPEHLVLAAQRLGLGLIEAASSRMPAGAHACSPTSIAPPRLADSGRRAGEAVRLGVRDRCDDRREDRSTEVRWGRGAMSKRGGAGYSSAAAALVVWCRGGKIRDRSEAGVVVVPGHGRVGGRRAGGELHLSQLVLLLPDHLE
ncbi:MAG: hypothetical protein M1826_004857 [Phylliscum demangeonii]|nr:MAG: hypothetical protein M1826_004857 [Phylliscum demangeonii]